MGLTIAELLPDYKASLNDAADVFGNDSSSPTQDENLTRHLNVAASALSADGKRRRIRYGTLSVIADQSFYEVPDDLIAPRTSLWSNTAREWDRPPGQIPAVYLFDGPDGKVLRLEPAPTAPQITFYGSTFTFVYLAANAITGDAGTSTLTENDRYIVILRAQVEAMREMTFRNIHKPVQLRAASGGGSTSNMQPSALYEKLLDEYKDAA